MVVEPEPAGEARLRALIGIAHETLPVMRAVLSREAGRAAPAVLRRLQAQQRLHERVLTLGLYTLSNLPDEPEERAKLVAATLRLCLALATLD